LTRSKATSSFASPIKVGSSSRRIASNSSSPTRDDNFQSTSRYSFSRAASLRSGALGESFKLIQISPLSYLDYLNALRIEGRSHYIVKVKVKKPQGFFSHGFSFIRLKQNWVYY
jgi:hypothetical protein